MPPISWFHLLSTYILIFPKRKPLGNTAGQKQLLKPRWEETQRAVSYCLVLHSLYLVKKKLKHIAQYVYNSIASVFFICFVFNSAHYFLHFFFPNSYSALFEDKVHLRYPVSIFHSLLLYLRVIIFTGWSHAKQWPPLILVLCTSCWCFLLWRLSVPD